jgi:hypothetical protein
VANRLITMVNADAYQRKEHVVEALARLLETTRSHKLARLMLYPRSISEEQPEHPDPKTYRKEHNVFNITNDRKQDPNWHQKKGRIVSKECTVLRNGDPAP